ncbi:MAG: tRNA uridine-5-carboxymethylaminomethyl(34) synthesis GTPase MnmE [Treponema sp.]|jgi:tRNA modification GTPase|nr:tRNA uridine-5-carboxymethylaminomethyl(34) synthesis GTPase MnmE [Treponema sp.]
MSASYGDESPIAALATTPGKSALALIRCSGKGVIETAAKVFSSPEKLLRALGNTVVHGWIITHNEKIDETLVSVFRGPKSYTGEDSLDISCHGGAACRAALEALRSAGFRDALPGEFTFRALMNGKLDLTRAESVMELVSARTDSGRRSAVNRLSGVLEKEINEIKQTLLEVLSGAEIFLDYSEEEIDCGEDEVAGRLPGRRKARKALERLQKLAASWQRERIYQEGILAVIAGRPNAGKSSLFNVLIKEDRSIVTDIPGTTRDWIEGCISIEGIPFRLADTAGLGESSDPVEKIGVERSRELLEEAELILYVIDGEEGFSKEDRVFIGELERDGGAGGKPFLLLWNKEDIAPMPSEAAGARALGISAKTGKGITGLVKAIAGMAADMAKNGAFASYPQDAALGSLRQKSLIDAAAAAVEMALHLADQEEPLDLIAPLLREAANALGEITGEVSTSDILEEMFSRFCVGK